VGRLAVAFGSGGGIPLVLKGSSPVGGPAGLRMSDRATRGSKLWLYFPSAGQRDTGSDPEPTPRVEWC
jgi:hypothetical protein